MSRRPGVRLRTGDQRDDPELWEEVPNEELRPGDLVDVLGIKRITRIRPYDGPHRSFIFALADTVPGVGFSLERGGTTRRLRSQKARTP